MQKQVLSEQSLYHGKVNMPKDWDIDRNYCFSDKTSIGEIFIDNNSDKKLINDCKFVLYFWNSKK